MLFISTETVRLGSSPTPFRKIGATSHVDLVTLATKFGDAVKLRLPPKRNIMQSRERPRAYVREDATELIQEIEACEVPLEYLSVLEWMSKRTFFRVYGDDGWESLKKLDFEIRAKLILLLTSGKWIDEPEDSRLQTLHTQLRNFDLGRRSDLNFSSQQSEASYEKSLRVKKVAFKQRQLEERIAARERIMSASPIPEDIAPGEPVGGTEEVPVFADRPWLKGVK